MVFVPGCHEKQLKIWMLLNKAKRLNWLWMIRCDVRKTMEINSDLFGCYLRYMNMPVFHEQNLLLHANGSDDAFFG